MTLNDSLLRLSAMSPEEQLAVVNKIIDDLKKKEKEEAEAARREEYLAQQAAQGSNFQNNGANTPNQFQLNTDKSWYFYNTATRNAGRTDFRKRWGSRKLEDDWRRRNKATFSMNDFGESGEEDSEQDDSQEPESAEAETADKEAQEHANDPHYPEYYLKQIPKDDVERTTAGEVIQEAFTTWG